MAWRSSGSSNAALIANLAENGLIKSDRVRKAMLHVDRAHYAPDLPYQDSPQSIGFSATISAPHMHASAAESLLPFLHPTSNVLDVGSGSGYLTHVLANLVEPEGKVVGVDHVQGLVDMANRNMGKSADGKELITSGCARFVKADGRQGWREGAPYDAIHVGAAALEAHGILIEQLKAPGRMFIPVGDKYSQYIWVIDKKENGRVERQKSFGVMPARGAMLITKTFAYLLAFPSMNHSVVARSLAALTALAANPPQCPQDPAHEVQEPLVLYIARVPGSRDLFLATLKPQQSVTAYDVENSLYYFHFDTEEDENIRETLSTEQELQGVNNEEKGNLRLTSSGHSPRRKPLSSIPLLASRDRPEPPPRINSHLQGAKSQKPLYAPLQLMPLYGTTGMLRSFIDTAPHEPARKLMGPRPMSFDALNPSMTRGSKQYLLARQQPEQLPALPLSSAPSDVEHSSKSHDISEAQNPLMTVQEREKASHMYQFVESITIIRRDPSSGGQWNVGKITSEVATPTLNEYLPSSGKFVLQPDRHLYIDITSTGYSKFIEYAANAPTPTLMRANIISAQTQAEPTLRCSSTRTSFRRQIFLEEPGGQSNRKSPQRNGFRSGADYKRGHNGSLPSADLESSDHARSPLPGSNTRPYTFQSPWNGTCEFSTGIAGRSLKCRHTLHSPVSSPESRVPSTATVSELRFNLPSSKLLGPLSPKRPPLVTGTLKRSSFFTGSHARGTPSMAAEGDAKDSESDGDERLDLSLGQEQAGGGLRGKQAKLGKLIIEDEGLQMLDLIVAANMGVWWSVYCKGQG